MVGFRCGFTGLRHMDIVRERLDRDYGIKLIVSAPSVVYRVHKQIGKGIPADDPALIPATGSRRWSWWTPCSIPKKWIP